MKTYETHNGHSQSECIHGIITKQCKCPGPKTHVLVPCADCEGDFPRLDHGKLMGMSQGWKLYGALEAWLKRAEQSYPGDVSAVKVIEAIEEAGWRLTYVGTDD
jgi:hypothetical protein